MTPIPSLLLPKKKHPQKNQQRTLAALTQVLDGVVVGVGVQSDLVDVSNATPIAQDVATHQDLGVGGRGRPLHHDGVCSGLGLQPCWSRRRLALCK